MLKWVFICSIYVYSSACELSQYSDNFLSFQYFCLLMSQLLNSITLPDSVCLWCQLTVELRKKSLSLTSLSSDNSDRYSDMCCDMSDLLSCALYSCFLTLSLICLFKFLISCFNCWSMSFCLNLLCLIMLQTLWVSILSRSISEVFLTFTIRFSVVCEATSCELRAVAIFS